MMTDRKSDAGVCGYTSGTAGSPIDSWASSSCLILSSYYTTAVTACRYSVCFVQGEYSSAWNGCYKE